LQNSGISSPATPSASRSPAGPTHKRFALKGRSVAIDPRVDAVRRDLADVRLADRVFAPHYAAPMPRLLRISAELKSDPAEGGDTLASLAAGETFEVLEIAGHRAWGVAPAQGLVGYVDLAALENVA
jgi:hypothetical protein